MPQALALFIKLAPYIDTARQIFDAIQAANELVAKASAEGRDLTDEEIAGVFERLEAADGAWQAALAQLRADAT